MSDMGGPTQLSGGQQDLGPRPSPQPVWKTVLLVDGAAFVAGLLPAAFLGTGIEAIGAHYGWWIGDVNANDGEQTWSTFLGLAGALPVLIAMIVTVVLYVRRSGKPALLLTTVNTIVFLAAYTAFMIWLFQPVPIEP